MDIEEIIGLWHTAIDQRDEQTIRQIVDDALEISGPKGSQTSSSELTGPDLMLDWLERSGIKLTPVDWHPVSWDVMVVGELALWPTNEVPITIYTRYTVRAGKIVSIHRYDDLHEALSAD